MKMSRELLQLAKDIVAFTEREGDGRIADLTLDEIANVIVVLSDYRDDVKLRLSIPSRTLNR